MKKKTYTISVPQIKWSVCGLFAALLLCVSVLLCFVLGREGYAKGASLLMVVGTSLAVLAATRGNMAPKVGARASKAVLLGFFAVLAATGVVLFVLWNLDLMSRQHIMFGEAVIKLLCTVLVLFGIFALAKSRLKDGRWLAIYVFALLMTSLCTILFSVLGSMNADVSTGIAMWYEAFVMGGLVLLVAIPSMIWLLAPKREKYCAYRKLNG